MDVKMIKMHLGSFECEYGKRRINEMIRIVNETITRIKCECSEYYEINKLDKIQEAIKIFDNPEKRDNHSIVHEASNILEEASRRLMDSLESYLEDEMEETSDAFDAVRALREMVIFAFMIISGDPYYWNEKHGIYSDDE